jgi:hypothetical protein
MNLIRLHAFTVEPSRTSEIPTNPIGGSVLITDELREVLTRNITTARFDRRTIVDFQADPARRSNETRDAVISYGFDDSQSADRSALLLANRLSVAMDLRSHPALFVVAAFGENSSRSIILWTFPRDAAFQFRTAQVGASIDILTDIFSQTSKLRKAARFEGRRLRNEFLSGRALDFQVNQKSKLVADFWISRFLQCILSLHADAGTRLVARAFRNAIDSCNNPNDQEALIGAVLALHHTRRRRWSPQQIADEFLDGQAKTEFLGAIPNPQTLTNTFDFLTETFDSVIRFRIFKLHTGVFVSSPLEEVGRTVKIQGDRERRLSCEGVIVEEKVRIQHA